MKNNNKKLFHGTIPLSSQKINADEFEFDFSYSIFGIHFGTKETATNRIPIKIAEMERLYNGSMDFNDFENRKEHPIIIEAEVTINNPIELSENRTGKWGCYDVISAVMEYAQKLEESNGDPYPFTTKEIDDYYSDELSLNGVSMNDLIDLEEYYGEDNDDEKLKVFVTKFLESKGYDSIVYKNEFELGGDSYIILKKEQIKVINIEFPNGEYTNKNKRKNKFI